MNAWTQPQFEELQMNAEIGAYQADPGDEREPPPVVSADLRSQTVEQREPA